VENCSGAAKCKSFRKVNWRTEGKSKFSPRIQILHTHAISKLYVLYDKCIQICHKVTIQKILGMYALAHLYSYLVNLCA
jgi:hypothetical protein